MLLEDDADRVRGFESAVAQLGPAYRLHVWRDAYRMMAECHEFLADTALISLDHDLDKETPDSPEPGDGAQAASFLARLPCFCPVILHTSNNDRIWSMDNEFRFGGWKAEHVMPFGTDWIGRSWLPVARKSLESFSATEMPYVQLTKPSDQSERLSRALLSLYGLAIGDGIGEMMFSRPDKAYRMVAEDELPAGPWWHTDDTEMAISIVEVLRLLGSINQDALARQFAWRYEREPDRGYGSGARRQTPEAVPRPALAVWWGLRESFAHAFGRLTAASWVKPFVSAARFHYSPLQSGSDEQLRRKGQLLVVDCGIAP